MRKILMIMALGLLLMSCQRRDIYYENVQYANLTIKVDWSKSFPDEDSKPTGMSVWFYPDGGGNPIIKSTNEVDNYKVRIPEGIYDILIFNQTPFELGKSLSFRGIESLQEAEVYSVLLDYKSWYEQQTSKPVHVQPKYFASVKHENVEVVSPLYDSDYTPEYAPERPPVDITIKMTPQMITKDVEILVHVKNAGSIKDIRSVVSGFAEGHLLNGQQQNSISSINIIDDWDIGDDSDSEETIIVFNLTSFGYKKTSDKSDSNTDYWNGELDLRFMLHDGEIENFIIPLDKDNIIETGNKLKMKLEIGIDNPIDLPDVPNPGNGGAGFEPDVEEWPEEDIVLPID